MLKSTHYSLYLMSSLRRYYDVELIDSLIGRREAACFLLVSAANVGDDAIEDNVRVFGDGTEVLRHTDEERHLFGAVGGETCNQHAISVHNLLSIYSGAANARTKNAATY